MHIWLSARASKGILNTTAVQPLGRVRARVKAFRIQLMRIALAPRSRGPWLEPRQVRIILLISQIAMHSVYTKVSGRFHVT